MNLQRSTLVVDNLAAQLTQSLPQYKAWMPTRRPRQISHEGVAAARRATLMLFFPYGMVFNAECSSFRLFLPANDSSWTKTEYYMRQWGIFNDPPRTPDFPDSSDDPDPPSPDSLSHPPRIFPQQLRCPKPSSVKARRDRDVPGS